MTEIDIPAKKYHNDTKIRRVVDGKTKTAL